VWIFVFFVPIFLFWLNLSLNSWDVLKQTTWNEVSLTLNKVKTSGNNLEINWNFWVNGKLCLENGQCLWECARYQHWNAATTSCTSNTKTCNITNWTWTQTWSGSSWWSCVVSSCNSGYHVVWNACTSNTQTRANQNCSGKIANSVWNLVSKITQMRTWKRNSRGSRSPTLTSVYNTSASSSACRYKCGSGYEWNGNTCVAPAWDCKYEQGNYQISTPCGNSEFLMGGRRNWNMKTPINNNTEIESDWWYEYKKWKFIRSFSWWWMIYFCFGVYEICRKPE